ncbi:DoxX family protein [Gluconacetobacter asukensis]|uniref:DoxX family protein n=1 Tax=Gluconacetobacter asukensis TaxID=1017181 RepID=A0A7W4IZC6_9PROT|nr:DoxX family protein [Gluconacetobacter asukensis]MBB2171790.1 DoxX family protein [Gluconacetobacter asukensis]
MSGASTSPIGPVMAVRQAIAWIEVAARQIAPPLLRVSLALPFLRSGLTRWDGFLSLSPGTLFLFEDQFKLHILGRERNLPAPDQLALLTATAEIVLPVLLLLGLGTRFAAQALLIMTGVIQLVFPDGWANFHLYWAAIAVGIVAIGPGGLSIDHWVDRRFRPLGGRRHEQ